MKNYIPRTVNLRILIAIPFFLIFASCADFVAVDLPDSQLNTPAVFENSTTANAAMIDIYAKIRDTGVLTGTPSGISNQLGNYADELTFYGNGTQPTASFYNNVLLPSNGSISEYWNTSYNQIYAANALIYGAQASAELTVDVKNGLTGEALFVRALLHFYLTNLYGDIPYITTTDYEANSHVGRLAVPLVYDNIINDLEQSITLLPDAYSSSDRVRPNKATAQALLARVYLYNGQWAESSNMASAVLNNESLYSWENDLDKIFLKGSATTIWQLSPSADGRNTEEARTFIFISGPPPLAALSDGLTNAFEPNDQRKLHWTASVSDGTNTWYYAYKYKQLDNTGSSVENSIIFRLAEQYLIRAEARAHEGDLIGAKEDLNKIRNTAGLPNTPAVTATDILAAILNERRFEFFAEGGQRFFDLKRTGAIDGVLSAAKPGWNNSDSLFPLPETELGLNPNLAPQNPGY